MLFPDTMVIKNIKLRKEMLHEKCFFNYLWTQHKIGLTLQCICNLGDSYDHLAPSKFAKIESNTHSPLPFNATWRLRLLWSLYVPGGKSREWSKLSSFCNPAWLACFPFMAHLPVLLMGGVPALYSLGTVCAIESWTKEAAWGQHSITSEKRYP